MTNKLAMTTQIFVAQSRDAVNNNDNNETTIETAKQTLNLKAR